jgi:pimeloyl-ACP methyl ester carboxylesterase
VPLTPDEQAKMRKDHADDHAHTDGCVALARKGALSMSDPHDCYAPAPGRTPGERAYLAYQFDRPGRYEAVQSEADSVFGVAPGDDEDSRKERKLAHRFGDMPITVLTASNPLEGSAAPAADHKVAFEAQWKAGHDALANRSVRGVSDVVPGAGHNIQLDQPQAVLDAIADVVARSRAKMEP